LLGTYLRDVQRNAESLLARSAEKSGETSHITVLSCTKKKRGAGSGPQRLGATADVRKKRYGTHRRIPAKIDADYASALPTQLYGELEHLPRDIGRHPTIQTDYKRCGIRRASFYLI
jgi:hypothetical protein